MILHHENFTGALRSKRGLGCFRCPRLSGADSSCRALSSAKGVQIRSRRRTTRSSEEGTVTPQSSKTEQHNLKLKEAPKPQTLNPMNPMNSINPINPINPKP